MNLRRSALILTAALLSAGLSAHASTITYTLTNVQLTLGVGGQNDGTLNGTFVIDPTKPVTSQLVMANITVGAATVAPFTGPAFTYTYGTTGTNDALSLSETSKVINLWANGGADQLELSFTSALGTGTDVLGSATQETETSLGNRDLSSVGTFSATVGSAAPEPSSIALLGTGLFSIGGLLRRRFTA